MPPDLKVLVLTPDFPPAAGGIQLLTHRVVRHATRVRARVVTVRGPGAGAFDVSAGLDVRRVGTGRQRLDVARLNLEALVEAGRLRPDVILCAHIITTPAAHVVKTLAHVPIVLYAHGHELTQRRRLAAFALRAADATIAVSRYTAQLARQASDGKARVRRIAPGVDAPRPRLAQRSPRPTVLCVARLRERYKGHDVLIRAMPLVRARVPEARLVVLGEGPLRPYLAQLSSAVGAAELVQFVGSLSDAERDAWFDRAHVFAMPSRIPPEPAAGEGFGIVYLEAGTHELPVVAGNAGGAIDAVVHGHTGLLVDPADHVAVADALAGLLQDKEYARSLGTTGAERARKFAWPLVARRVEDLLFEVAGRAI